jgi:Immunoglobulin domain
MEKNACSQSPSPPQYVFWYHNDRMINYDTARGGISVETEPGPKTHSRLIIRDAHETDSGNYTCSASNTEPASIYVFVSEGKSRRRLKMKMYPTRARNAQILPRQFSLSLLTVPRPKTQTRKFRTRHGHKLFTLRKSIETASYVKTRGTQF